MVKVTLTNYAHMFAGTSVTKVTSTNKKVTDMSSMFYKSQASLLDLSSFDTSNVTDMNGMFGRFQASSLELSNFNTSNVNDMSYMFQNSKATTGYAKTQA